MNSTDSSETGVIPFHAHFGTDDATYHIMPDVTTDADRTHSFIRLLDDNLKTLRDVSKVYQDKLIAERTAPTPLETQNKYKPGDFVLFKNDSNHPTRTKLTPRYLGPYEVIHQVSNNVTCRDMVEKKVIVLHANRLKIFIGTKDEAYKVALLDNDQYVVVKYLAYRGDPDTRSTVEFEIYYQDNTTSWLTWSQDLYSTIQYEDFCSSRPELRPLLYKQTEAQADKTKINKKPITTVKPGDTVYVDLRYYGFAWYESLLLPDSAHVLYVVEMLYIDLSSSKRKITAKCILFDEVLVFDHYTVVRFGSNKNVNDMKLIDAKFCIQYPQVLPDNSRNKLLKQFKRT
jgi:hypothetical protein